MLLRTALLIVGISIAAATPVLAQHNDRGRGERHDHRDRGWHGNRWHGERWRDGRDWRRDRHWREDRRRWHSDMWYR